MRSKLATFKPLRQNIIKLIKKSQQQTWMPWNQHEFKIKIKYIWTIWLWQYLNHYKNYYIGIKINFI